MSLASGSSTNLTLNGTAVGTGYDQLNVNGTVTIAAGSILNLFGSALPSYGNQLTIIHSTSAIVGIFDKLDGTPIADGSEVVVNNVTYTINYEGGSGDDVVLTDVTPDAPTNLSGKTNRDSRPFQKGKTNRDSRPFQKGNRKNNYGQP